MSARDAEGITENIAYYCRCTDDARCGHGGGGGEEFMIQVYCCSVCVVEAVCGERDVCGWPAVGLFVPCGLFAPSLESLSCTVVKPGVCIVACLLAVLLDVLYCVPRWGMLQYRSGISS